MPEEQLSPEEQQQLKAARKKSANVAMLLGGLAFVIGSLICLAYLLIAQPWKLPWVYKP